METQIITLNIRGLGNTQKRKTCFEWLKQNNFNIILLQEVHCDNKTKLKWKDEWDGPCIFSGNSSQKEGVAILINPRTNIQIEKELELKVGRLIGIEITLNEKPITILNIYGPNKDDISLFKLLESTLLENDEKTYIIGGDFNTVLNSELDKKNGNPNHHHKCRDTLLEIMKVSNLVDAWRIQHENKKQYTWHSTKSPVVHCRLDFFLISENMVNTLKTSSIKPSDKTDHTMASITIDNLKPEKGPGYFKLNNSIL